jgi:hypothetical protein
MKTRMKDRKVTIMSPNADEVTRQTEGPSHEAIALRAYGLWEGRGCPIGSPEEDWFRAEREIVGQEGWATKALARAASVSMKG